MTLHNSHGHKEESRRTFIRRVGKSIIAISVVDILFGHPSPAFACGEGACDASCGTSYSADENCGVNNDPDNNCGMLPQQSNDANCGKPSVSPSNTDTDQTCVPESSDSDANCSIAQMPSNGLDVDESCNNQGGDPDQSCGDCNDNHQTDEHCNQGGDPDDLCGHQSLYGWMNTDGACSASVPDVGCGDHSTSYGSAGDTDQHCVGGNTDMNCSLSGIEDTNCNAAANPSTSSPDEHCSQLDYDQACNMYDKDQSCGSAAFDNPADQACGQTIVEGIGGGTWTDTDNHCNPGGGDPDNSNDIAGS
ncbi:MAG: hypothetical protein ABFC77_02650 [Thermoguttaceae bacterium]